MIHILKFAIPALLMLGSVALPARRERARFVMLLFGVFIAGGIAASALRIGLPLGMLAYQQFRAADTCPTQARPAE